MMQIPEGYFHRRWVCGVTSSGYHNGAGCTPEDPHDRTVWGCSHRWEASISDSKWRELRLQQEPTS